jgi:uncharacterized repeat protein (TIGR03803 family)
VRGANGALYGTTYGGGASQLGVVYRIDSAGTFSVLHSFGGPDGEGPSGALVSSSAGLYGTTGTGGARGYGTFYRIDNAGTFALLHSFIEFCVNNRTE